MSATKWTGWTHVQLQEAIVEQNHHISKTTAAAEALANALRVAEATIERLAPGGSRATQGTRDVITAALAQWEEVSK